MSITYIPRVTQIDSKYLDDQLEELFKELLFQSTKYFQPGVLQCILPELELFIRGWIFKHSICDKRCTFGQQMLSMKYNTENFSNSKLCWYFFYTIGLKYIKDRALYSYTSNIKIQNVLNKIEKVQLIGDILNFLRFIQSGKHPTLIDFVLGLHLTADKITRENLNDFSWTRELLWHNLIELTGTVLSLVNMFGLKQKLLKLIRYSWWTSYMQKSSKGKLSTEAVMTLNTLCPCCSSRPILPHVMGCSHIFCYYCLVGWRRAGFSQATGGLGLRCHLRPGDPHGASAYHIKKANKMADNDFMCPKCYYNGKEASKYIVT